jgi:hypothetical protein
MDPRAARFVIRMASLESESLSVLSEASRAAAATCPA